MERDAQIKKALTAKQLTPYIVSESSNLEFCGFWSSWERNNVADILHTCHEKEQALEAQTKARVRTRTELTGI